MKKILFLIFLAVMSISASADETITVEKLTIPQGKQAEMVVNFKFNETHEYVSYQFTVELPDGVSLVADEYGKAGYALPDNQPAALFNVDFLASNGILKVYSSPSTAIGGSTGVLVRIPVEASEELAVGATLSGRLKDVEFTKNTGAVRTPFADADIDIEIAEPRIVFDENSTTLPVYTAGTKDNVSMKRTIKKDEWSTIVLPFTLSKSKAESIFGSDVQLAEFSGFTTEYADEYDVSPDAITVNFTTYTMTAQKGMTGGKPFLIKTSKDIESFVADNVTLVGTVTDVTKYDDYDTAGKFTGTLVKTTVPEDGLFVNGGNFWYSKGTSVAKGFRCWLELGAILDKDTDFESRVMLNIIDGTTDIDDVNRGTTPEDRYYNLNGQRIDKPGKKGLYIKGNRKVIVK